MRNLIWRCPSRCVSLCCVLQLSPLLLEGVVGIARALPSSFSRATLCLCRFCQCRKLVDDRDVLHASRVRALVGFCNRRVVFLALQQGNFFPVGSIRVEIRFDGLVVSVLFARGLAREVGVPCVLVIIKSHGAGGAGGFGAARLLLARVFGLSVAITWKWVLMCINVC